MNQSNSLSDSQEKRALAQQVSKNYTSNSDAGRCDFCSLQGLILQQLRRLKEAVLIKNSRIKELQSFIKKVSQMAFFDPHTVSQQEASSFQNQIRNFDQQSSKRNVSASHLQELTEKEKVRLNDSSEISFRNVKINSNHAAEPYGKQPKEDSLSHFENHEFNLGRSWMSIKEHERAMLQDLKRAQMQKIESEIQRKFGSTPKEFSQPIYEQPSSFQHHQNSSQVEGQYESYRTFSEPRSQAPIREILEVSQQFDRNFKQESVEQHGSFSPQKRQQDGKKESSKDSQSIGPIQAIKEYVNSKLMI